MSKRCKQGRSMLDFVGEQSKRLEPLAFAGRSAADGSVLHLRPRTGTAAAQSPRSGNTNPSRRSTPSRRKTSTTPKEFVRKTRLMFDVIKLALETDSSRLVSLFIDTTVIHNITHHGNRPEVLAELRGNEEGQFDALERIPQFARPRRRKRANRCSTARWCCTAPAWGAPTPTRT